MFTETRSDRVDDEEDVMINNDNNNNNNQTNVSRAYDQYNTNTTNMNRQLRVQIPKGTATILMVFVTWVMLYCVLGEVFLPHTTKMKNDTEIIIPGGAVFSLIFIWAAAHIGASIAKFANVPPLLGMLLSGLLVRNVPGDLVESLPNEWSSATRAAGLSVILMRSGLELDLEAFQRVGLAAARLTVLPGVSEAILTGFVATALFNVSIPLGLCLGFILAAVSPAVVVGGMFDLQARGYGVAKGIPSLIVAAASFDDVVAITGYTIMKSFAIPSDEHNNLAWTIMHGPTDVILGICAGSFAGYILLGATAIWNKPWKRSLLTFELGMAMMFLGRKYELSGGGAMASLAMGISANKAWTKGRCPIPLTRDRFSLGARPELAHSVEVDLSRAWRTLFQPLLFGVIGSAVKFADLTASTIPKSILLLFCGLCIRLPMAFFAVQGGNLNFKERAFVSLAWLPKATVQAALASDPLEAILKSKTGEANYEEWVKWGNDILTTAVFSIIITAPVGMVIISTLGPKWLNQDTKRQQYTDVAPDSAPATTGLAGFNNNGSIMNNNIFNGSDKHHHHYLPSSADGKNLTVGGDASVSFEDSPSAGARRNSFGPLGEAVNKIASMVSSRNPSARHTPFEQSESDEDEDEEEKYDEWGDYEHRGELQSPPRRRKVTLPRTTSAVFKKHMSVIANMEDKIVDEGMRRDFAIAKMGVESIMREHMPRDSEIETAGAFFRKTSIGEGKMDLVDLEELGVDTSEMVDSTTTTTTTTNLEANKNNSSPGGKEFDNRGRRSRSPPPAAALEKVQESPPPNGGSANNV